MKFASVCPLMFLAAASALELPSTYPYANMFESSRFNNRFNWRTRAASSNIIDRNGWATGTPPTFVGTNAAWFGGCRFKPAKMFEEYMNAYSTNSQAAAGHVMNFQNKRLSGLATYRCEDNAATGEGGTHQCFLSARARGFYWDWFAQAGTVVTGTAAAVGQITMSTYHPMVYGALDAATTPLELDDQAMTDYCTIRDVTNLLGVKTAAGTLDAAAVNRFAGDTGVEAAITLASQATFRYSNFATDEFTFASTNNSLQASWYSSTGNTSFKYASVVLSNFQAVDGGTFNQAGIDADKPGQPELEALADHAKIPNIACCKLEQWPKRTHMRYKKQIADYVTRICADTTKKGISLSCQAATAI